MRLRALPMASALLLAGAISPVAAQTATSAAVQDPAAAAAFVRFDRAVEQTKKAMMGNPQAALASARVAVAVAATLPPSRRARVHAITAAWLHGEALIFNNDTTAAMPVVTDALAKVERTAPDTKLHGDLLRARGAILWLQGKVQGALEDYQRAHDVFQRAGEARSRAIILEDLGRIYWDAGDYKRTLAYYDQSAEVFEGEAALRLTQQNNRGETFRKLNRHEDAVSAYRAALVEARKLGSPLLQVRVLTNLTEAEADAGNLRMAELAADQALRLSGRGEAAASRPFVYGATARIAAKKGDYARAAALLANTFRGVDIDKTDMTYREYHNTAAQVFEALGDTRMALRHVKAYQRLEKEVQQLTASTASQLMAARFDFANQDVKIAKLREDQYRREAAAERERSRTRTTLFTALLIAGGLVVAALLLGFFAVRRSRDAVRAANGSLREVNGALEKALKVKTEFLATTSHEIRTPLNGILGMTQVMLADRSVAPALRERIEVVHGAGETMKALVDDILDVAKMESGELTVEHAPTELDSILEDAARLWSGQAQAKGLALALERDGAPKRIMSDPARLRQIVFNLMSNALKFTAQGGVTLSATAELDASGEERLIIRVRDTGIGIPSDKRQEIFEAFKQVDSGVTRQFGGTGLGLAICKQLAIALGGDIGVDSVEGEGTTFNVDLPLVRVAASDEAAPANDPSRDALAAVRVLIVDRNPANQSVMRLMLAAEAESVAVAASLREALDALASAEASHLIVDAASAGDTAPERVAALRALTAATRDAGARCTLLLSPDAAELTVAAAMMVGADQLIVTPVGAVELMGALRSLHAGEPECFVAPSLLKAA
jgi:signal transduction histidine kinase/tetratricopeptide (TPR) repeat protein